MSNIGSAQELYPFFRLEHEDRRIIISSAGNCHISSPLYDTSRRTHVQAEDRSRDDAISAWSTMTFFHRCRNSQQRQQSSLYVQMTQNIARRRTIWVLGQELVGQQWRCSDQKKHPLPSESPIHYQRRRRSNITKGNTIIASIHHSYVVCPATASNQLVVASRTIDCIKIEQSKTIEEESVVHCKVHNSTHIAF